MAKNTVPAVRVKLSAPGKTAVQVNIKVIEKYLTRNYCCFMAFALVTFLRKDEYRTVQGLSSSVYPIHNRSVRVDNENIQK